MFYYLVKPESKEHGLLDKFTYQLKPWNEKKEEIVKFLGTENVYENLAVDSHCLLIMNVPEHLEKQFTKQTRNGYRVARANSHIQKEWTKFCKEHGLYSYDQTSLYIELGLVMIGGIRIEFIEDPNGIDFILMSEEVDFSAEGNNHREYLQPITEKTFLQMKLAAIEAESKKRE